MIIPLEQKADSFCDCEACAFIRTRNKWLADHYDCPVEHVLTSDTCAEVGRLNCRRHKSIFMNKIKD